MITNQQQKEPESMFIDFFREGKGEIGKEKKERERERERERKKDKERETSISCPLHAPQLGLEPPTWVCALTWT